MTVLGDCGSLATTPYISVNELTTVAAAYALAPFSLGSTNIGSTATNTAALRSAMRTAMLLADSYSGSMPSTAMPTNATMEVAKLITLGNIISTCVKSDGGTPCSMIATHAGLLASIDTFNVALTIAKNPGMHVAALFKSLQLQYFSRKTAFSANLAGAD